MIAQRIGSLEEIARRSSSKDDFWLNLGDFLDGFYHHPDPSALRDEPLFLSEKLANGPYFDAYLAGLGEHLARQYRFPVPSWVEHPKRILLRPVFAFDTYEGKMFLLVESPPAFRARNIFISADALTRV